MAGTYYNTVYLRNYANQNPFTVTSSGLVSVSSGDGIVGTGNYHWTVQNQGTIASTGIAVVGIDLASGTGGVVNNGRSGSTGGVISSSDLGVEIAGAGAVSNYGTIT